MYLKIYSLVCISWFSFFGQTVHAQVDTDDKKSRLDMLPVQSFPPTPIESTNPVEIYNFGPSTNLVSLLENIRNLSNSGEFDKAQKMASTALEKIAETKQNNYFLRQIRKEETKLYFSRANQAMRDKNYTLASQLLSRYRENVSSELNDRKREREQLIANKGSDATLVGKLVDELDKAKKDLAQIRAKAGLPEDDARPDYERLMEAEKAKMSTLLRRAERLLEKGKKDGADGQYDLAADQLDEALEILPSNVSSIALISDIYKAKQQIIWYRMGEAMLKGKVGQVEDLVTKFEAVEKSWRDAETETLGIEEQTDFDGEMQKAKEKAEEQAVLAEELLAKAKGMVRKKKYDEAEESLFKIKNFLEPNTRTWPIILEAALMRNRINLEKAEDARLEKDWDLSNQYLDAFRTGFYQDRDIQGDPLSYGRPGLKSTEGESAVKDELGKANRMEARIQSDKANPYKRDISEFTSNWKDQQEMLKELLMRAKVQFINGDLTGATETYRNIETRYSDNYEAKVMLKRISKMRSEESYLGYLKTRQEMLEEIEREWERPKVFDRQIEEVEKVKEVASNLEQKLKIIQIPGVQFFESPLPEVMQELQRQAKAFDLTEPDPSKKGVNIIPLANGDEPFPNVTITLNSMPLGQMIQFIAEMVSWTYDVRSDAIVVSKSGGTFTGRSLETEFYEVTQGTIQRMTGGAGAAGGGGGADPFAAPGGGGGGGADDTGIKIKAFLEGAGIPFDDTKGHKFVFDGFQMIVTHERRFLDLIERILERLDADSSRQVEIETKFLEVQEGALDEVSFDWQYSWGDPQYILDPETLNPVVDSTGQPVVSFGKSFTGNTRTLATAHSASGMSRDTIISIPDNADANLNIPNPTPTLPGKISIGQGVSPLLSVANQSLSFGGGAGSLILGGSQAKLLINALKRKQGTDLLSAPRITVMDGQPAQITIAQEFIYPTDYEPAPVPGGGGGGGAGAAGGAAALAQAIQIQSAVPQFDTVAPDDEQPGFREVGVVMDVTPRIEKYNSIALELAPKVTEFDGFIEYGGSSAMIGTSAVGSPPMIIQPSGILMPIFSVRKVNTSVTIFDGATVIIGGLTREEVKTVNDKIPVLGNIPLIGRLFQSSAESYSKRNLLIFVSASIVSRGGSPVREVIQNISPQSIFKDPVIMTPTGTIRRAVKDDVVAP